MGLDPPARGGADRARHVVGAGPLAPRAPATESITLEVCPSSNIATRAVATLAEHPRWRSSRRACR
nr:hypothetical protein [Nocardioides sp. B-3]